VALGSIAELKLCSSRLTAISCGRRRAGILRLPQSIAVKLLLDSFSRFVLLSFLLRRTRAARFVWYVRA